MGNSTSHSASFVAESKAHSSTGSSIRTVNCFEMVCIPIIHKVTACRNSQAATLVERSAAFSASSDTWKRKRKEKNRLHLLAST